MMNNLEYCCPQEVEHCVPEPVNICAEYAKKEYEDYLLAEECKQEEEVCFNICDFDENEIYFMQYRSKRAFYNEWWKKDLYKDIYNFRAHKYKKNKGN